MTYLGYGNSFLDTIPQAWSMNKKWQVKLIKMKNFYSTKEILKKTNRQATDGEDHS